MAEKSYKTLPFGYKRVDAAPLEANTVFSTVDDAVSYARNDATAYAGQQLAVVTDETSELYIINPDKTLSSFQADTRSTGTGLMTIIKFPEINASLDGDGAIKILTVPAGVYLEDAVLTVLEPLTAGTNISIGDENDRIAFMTESDIDATQAAVYEVDINFIDETADKQIWLYVDGTATEGKIKFKMTTA